MKKIYEMIVTVANSSFRAFPATRRKIVISSVSLLAFLFAGAQAGAVVTTSVSLKAPFTGESFLAPASIALTAEASGGVITNVSFYSGTNLLGSATNAPYTCIWTNVAAGSYSLTAQAANNSGAVVTSAVAAVQVLDIVISSTNFTTAGSTNWTCPANVTSVVVECWGAGGAGGSAQGTSNGTTQYGGGGAGGAYARYNVYPVVPGSKYYINVGAGGYNNFLDNDTRVSGGDSWFNADNAPSSIIIAKGGAGGESAVGSTITTGYGLGGTGTTAGSAGNIVYAGGSGAAGAENSAGGGGSSAGTNSAGESATSNEGAAAPVGGGNGGAGSTVSEAVGGNGFAPGGGGSGAESRSLTLKVGGTGAPGKVVLTFVSNVAPSVVLSAPTNGAVFVIPATIALTANASDADGVITNVSFYNGATRLGSATNVPYTYMWTNATAGSPSLTARATDNSGLVRTSAVVTITVASPTYALTVTSGTGGGSYTNGQRVAIAASNAPSGTAFDQWIGDTQYVDSVVSSNSTVTMPAQAIALTATYKDARYTLTVTNGTGSGSYTNGTVVPIVASNAPFGQVFDQWTGATQHLASVAASNTTVTMPASNIAVAATYKNVYALTVVDGSGDGLYTNGAQVLISAEAPVIGKAFDRWIGDTQRVNNVTYTNALVTMSNNAVTLTATYKDVYYALTVTGGSGSGSYTNGQRVGISASNAPSGQVFDRWVGDVQVVNNVTYTNALVTMPAQAISLTATYKAVSSYYTLTVSNGTGGGIYSNGAQVAISAIAPNGTAFSRWAGDTQAVADVFSLNTIVTMPAQNTALTAVCVNASNGVVNVDWVVSGGVWLGADSSLGLLGPVGSGKSTIAQLMYSPDDIKDDILPSGAGAVNDVVLDRVTVTENGDGLSDYGIFSASTVRAWTNGYVYALIFQDNNVQPGDWYLASTPLMALEQMATNATPQGIMIDAGGGGDQIDGPNGAQVIAASAGYTLTVNSGSGGGTYTNTQVVPISANPPASGKVFDKWIGDTQVVNNVSYTNAVVTMSANNVSLTATYKYLPGQHTLTVTNGTGGGTYSNGTEVAIAASNLTGKAFVQWIGDTQYVASVISANTTVTMSGQNVALTATYTNVPYTLTVTSGSGDGSYTNGAKVLITAETIFAKSFVRWAGDTQYLDNSNSASTTVTMPAQAVSLTATYTDVLYALSVNSGIGSGSYAYGAQVSITASNAPSGQAFDRWAGDTQYLANSNSASTTVTMPARAVSLTAIYKTVYIVTVNGGTGSGLCVYQQLQAIGANPAPNGTVFDRWTGDTQFLSFTNTAPNNQVGSMPKQDVTVTATYKNLTNYFTLTVNGGSGGGAYTNGTNVAISATATSRTFIAWIGNTNVLSSNTASTTVTMPASNIAVTVIYSNVLLTVNGGAGGGTYTNGQQVAIAASNISGRAFDKWTGATQYVAGVTNTNALVTLPAQDITLTATYKYVYTLTVSNGNGSGAYTNGARVTITASNAPGKMFDRWIGDTQYVASVISSNTTVTMPASNITVTATYKDVYVLTVSNGTGSGSSYTNTQVVAITASNAPFGMTFDKWTGDASYVASVTSAATKVTMPASNIAVSATYTNTYVLTVTDGTGGGAYTEGSLVTIKAIVPVGQDFDQWTGQTQYVANVMSSNTTVTMPAEAVSVAAIYQTARYAFTVIGGTGSGSYTNGQRIAIAATVPTGLTFLNWNDGNKNASRTVTMPPAPITYTATLIDLQKPTVKITYPANKSKVMTNGTVIIRGTAADNVGLTGVMHQLYTGEWTNAVTTNVWKNWTANFYPVSGLNTARVYSVDTQGNTSETATVVFTYVPGAVMQVQINGDGTVKPDYDGKMLEIGKRYTMSARAAKYSSFTDWTGIGGSFVSSKTGISFVMQSNLVLTANFHSWLVRATMADITVAAPTTPQAAITVDGSAKDWANVPRSSFSYASVTQEVAAVLDGNNIALLLAGCPFETSDNVLVYFKLRLSYGSGDNRHSVDLWTSGSVLYGMVDGQVITGLEAVMLDGVLEVKLPVEQAPSQVTIEEIGGGMDLGGGTLTELFKLTPPPALTQ